MAEIGHNSGDVESVDVIGAAAREQLRNFVARIERLEEEAAEIAEDKKGVYSEARAMGFDTKVLRKVISLRKMDRNARAELEALIDLYMGAIDGKIADLV